jgi:hypothetical protein
MIIHTRRLLLKRDKAIFWQFYMVCWWNLSASWNSDDSVFRFLFTLFHSIASMIWIGFDSGLSIYDGHTVFTSEINRLIDSFHDFRSSGIPESSIAIRMSTSLLFGDRCVILPDKR